MAPPAQKPQRLLLALMQASVGVLLFHAFDAGRARYAVMDEALAVIAALLLLGSAIVTAVLRLRSTRSSNTPSQAKELLESNRRDAAIVGLLENSADLLLVVGADGRTLYASPSCNQLLGFSAYELQALPAGALLHDEERAMLRATAAELQQSRNGSRVLLHRMRTSDGTYRWFETNLQPAPPEFGAGALHLTSRDATTRKLAEDALRAESNRLTSVLASIGDGVVVLDADRKLLVVNSVAREYVHQAEGELAPKDWSSLHRAYLLDGVTPYPAELGPLTAALRGIACDAVDIMICDRNDQMRSFSITARPLTQGSDVVGCVAIYRENTEQLRAAKELRESEERYRVLADATHEGVMIVQTGIVIEANGVLARMLALDASQIVGSVSLNVFAEEDREQVDVMSAHSENAFEARLVRSDGLHIPVEVRGRETRFKGETVRIAVIRDITEKRAREAELKQQAELLRALSLRDELTGLLNRRGFLEHAAQQLRMTARMGCSSCLFFIDLDSMKSINDAFGHDVGDRALIGAAEVLRRAFRSADIIARLGGDEFAVFAADCAEQAAPVIRQRLEEHVQSYNKLSGEKFQLSMSIGAVTCAPNEDASLDSLISRADAKMYQAKHGAVAIE